MNRRTKGGGFLAEMVRQGLLQVISGDAETAPFEATYQLTEVGKHAAEHGVYELDWEQCKAMTTG